uniref:Uncharacterized protein n=1 Tax=Opuntia streptacantha TaxID=393608 RepID=A0A7C8ZRN0_OPUST
MASPSSALSFLIFKFSSFNFWRANGESDKNFIAKVMRIGTESSPGIIISIRLSDIKSSVNCPLWSFNRTSSTSFGSDPEILFALLVCIIFFTNLTISFFAFNER